MFRRKPRKICLFQYQLKKIECKINFVEAFRFMSTSLSSLTDNPSDEPQSDKCIVCMSYLHYMLIKDDQFILTCFEWEKNYKKDFDKDLIKRFANTYEFCDGDINKFIYFY